AHQAWHAKAKKTIRRDRSNYVLLAVTVVSTAASGVLELSKVGQRTPVIPFMFMARCASSDQRAW
ncbi:unnamed protein product, partial [Laminaria digitata]